MKDRQRLANERYIVKPEDITGDIAGFPIEVVQWMVDEQVRQGGNANIEAFQRSDTSGSDLDYIWGKSRETLRFWHKVVSDGRTDLFYELYPRTKSPNSRKGGTGDVPFVRPENTGTPFFRPLENGDLLPTPKHIWHGTHIPPGGPTSHGAIMKFDPEKDLYSQRLYETAKAAMQGLLANPASKPDWLSGHSVSELCELSILTAKELLRQLGEEKENETPKI